MEELLKDLHACKDAREWAADKTWPEIYQTCHRGDWLLWLFKKTNPDDLQRLTLAKGYCAATVLHLIKDKRSKDAVQAAIDFGEGKITKEELKVFAAAAADAYAANTAGYAAGYAADAAGYAAANAAGYAANTAGYAADAAANAAGYAANTAGYAAASDAKQKQTADICRKYLPIEVWNVKL
jgi:hypothetical protein